MKVKSNVELFQSTLPREERRWLYCSDCRLYNFNPRSHERSDDITIKWFGIGVISIHAPTRGATLQLILLSLVILFQSTLPREERRCLDFAVAVCDSKFQSTLPREERLRQIFINNTKFIFQSTLPREERLK